MITRVPLHTPLKYERTFALHVILVCENQRNILYSIFKSLNFANEEEEGQTLVFSYQVFKREWGTDRTQEPSAARGLVGTVSTVLVTTGRASEAAEANTAPFTTVYTILS